MPATAIRLLANREHSQRELRDKLLQRFPEEGGAVDELVASLSQQGLQSDARLIESRIQLRVRKGYGPVAIAHELTQLGIDKAMQAQAFAAAAIDWPAELARVYTQKYRNARVVDQRDKAKRYRFLASRGFPSELIQKILRTPP